MEINSLVIHKHLNSLGVGVVSQNLKKAIRVRFGENDMRKFKPTELRMVDISKYKTIAIGEFQKEKFCNSVKNEYMIIDNHLKQFTDSGWMSVRTVVEEDLEKYKIVI